LEDENEFLDTQFYASRYIYPHRRSLQAAFLLFPITYPKSHRKYPIAMQHVLQTALSVGFSATEGFHSSKPNKVDPSFNGMEAVLPQSFVPQTSTRLTLKGKKVDVRIPWMCIGAWSWGDKATWHWDSKELKGVTDAWKYLNDNDLICKCLLDLEE
jgi:hypothetical protein